MKIISDLQIALNKESFYNDQFKANKKKHILFLTCQLSSKDFYTKILPFMLLYKDDTATAMINLDKYSPEEQLTDINVYFKEVTDLLWADFIVIPFTIKPLKVFLRKLKEINPKCKIIYWIDYNFYELPENSPLKKHFTKEAINNVEENIWNSDICRVTQQGLHQYLITKLNDLAATKFAGVHSEVALDLQPILINQEIVLANVDYNPQEPKLVEKKPKQPISEEKTYENKDVKNNTTTDKIKPETKNVVNEKNASEKTTNKNSTKPNTQEQKIKETLADTKKVFVSFENENWVVKKAKNTDPIASFDNKKDAVSEGMKLHKKGNHLIVYTKDGKIHFQEKVRKDAKKR